MNLGASMVLMLLLQAGGIGAYSAVMATHYQDEDAAGGITEEERFNRPAADALSNCKLVVQTMITLSPDVPVSAIMAAFKQCLLDHKVVI